jgi:decaprenyl-phosphate phosphoribosyltransferase
MSSQPPFSLPQAIRLIRPKQWIKNGFVFAPLIFSRQLFDPTRLGMTFRAFAAFCLTASSIYIINDFADLEADRAHPEKRNRPLAAGTLRVGHALLILALLLTGVVVLAAGMNLRFIAFLITYFAMNLAYSLKLRDVFLLDVFIIAAGFMLRVLGGAYAIDVTVSSWLVLCSLFISLFLGFAKRRGELVQSEHLHTKRSTLKLYRVDFIDQLLTIAAAGTVISYALYTVAPRTVEVFGTDRLIYTTVFVMYGVFRYMYLIHTSSTVENPTNAVTADPPIIINALLWIGVCVFLIYYGGGIPGLSR